MIREKLLRSHASNFQTFFSIRVADTWHLDSHRLWGRIPLPTNQTIHQPYPLPTAEQVKGSFFGHESNTRVAALPLAAEMLYKMSSCSWKTTKQN